MEQGREVFALPWSIFHAGGAGCLHLIRDGAKMVQVIEDVLEELGALFALQQDLSAVQEGGHADGGVSSAQQEQVLALVGFEVVTADQLVQHSALSMARLLAELSALELQGRIERIAGGYIRC